MQLDSNMRSDEPDDVGLVNACLKGDREAFARIVTRYQALVASIAYSATGSIAQSEDLAQETFVAAWRYLGALAEPGKLRQWLCGIARRTTANALRRGQREPAQTAEPLDEVSSAPVETALPSDYAISREEEAILWRSLERIPETYREPLILFYREEQSIERVAEELELSQDAVRQRLSRGRKLLENEVAIFVEGALRKSAPGRSFTAGVLSVLPAQMAGSGFASLSVTAAKSGAVKAAGLLGALASLAGFLPGLVSSYQGYKSDMAQATSEAARRAVRRFYAILAACALAPVVMIYVELSLRALAVNHTTAFTALTILVGLSWVPCAFILLALMKQKAISAAANVDPSKVPPLLEWRSKATFLGLPLVHFRHGGNPAAGCQPVKAWIAVGDVALGGLFAFGSIAVAPISIGGFALGAAVFGGFAAGILTYSGFGFGVWGIGGCMMAWFAVGGCAIGWTASLGGIAIARQFAVGGVAVALHANDAAAHAFIENRTFFPIAFLLVTKWLWPTMLAATIPTILLTIAGRRAKRRAPQT